MIGQVSQWLYQSILSIFNSILSWGIIGLGLVSVHILGRVVNFIKKFFK